MSLTPDVCEGIQMKIALLYVNSLCIDKANEYEIAKGGACCFSRRGIVYEIASEAEGVLLTEQ